MLTILASLAFKSKPQKVILRVKELSEFCFRAGGAKSLQNLFLIGSKSKDLFLASVSRVGRWNVGSEQVRRPLSFDLI